MASAWLLHRFISQANCCVYTGNALCDGPNDGQEQLTVMINPEIEPLGQEKELIGKLAYPYPI